MFCVLIYQYEEYLRDASIIFETIKKSGGSVVDFGASSGLSIKIECEDFDNFHNKYKALNTLDQPWAYIRDWEKYKENN